MYVYTRKKCEKYCSTSHQKGWKCPFYKVLKEKRKHKNDEKRKMRIKGFEGQQDYHAWL